mmetsp:Transcript_65961/g.175684  ORF Transcript_65961/g.175684 Transcript_65961/m.175684 type:complete len:275 (-) Transcript_65961:211-1035(-)
MQASACAPSAGADGQRLPGVCRESLLLGPPRARSAPGGPGLEAHAVKLLGRVALAPALLGRRAHGRRPAVRARAALVPRAVRVAVRAEDQLPDLARLGLGLQAVEGLGLLALVPVVVGRRAHEGPVGTAAALVARAEVVRVGARLAGHLRPDLADRLGAVDGLGMLAVAEAEGGGGADRRPVGARAALVAAAGLAAGARDARAHLAGPLVGGQAVGGLRPRAVLPVELGRGADLAVGAALVALAAAAARAGHPVADGARGRGLPQAGLVRGLQL